jgi:hypothetical protein
MVFNCSGTETLFWNPQNRLITFFIFLYIAYNISQKHSLFHEKIKIFPVAAFTSPPAKLSCHKFPPPPWREAIWKQQLHWALSLNLRPRPSFIDMIKQPARSLMTALTAVYTQLFDKCQIIKHLFKKLSLTVNNGTTSQFAGRVQSNGNAGLSRTKRHIWSPFYRPQK